jgi:competence protein ComEA
MRFRDGARSVASAEAEAVASTARLTRVVGPEPGVYRLEPSDGSPGDGPVWPAERAGDGGVDGASVGGAGASVGGAGASVGGAGASVGGAGARAGGVDPAAARRALAALDPGRRAVRALAVVALVVAIVVGFLVWRSRPHAEPVPAVAASAVAAPSTSSATIVVSVLGRVQRPGLVRLPYGARVADAIEAAGGVLPGTDLGYLNLARKVVDGELLAIGVGPVPSAPVTGAPGGAGPPGLINLNTATVAELDTLPGVGPVLAQRIVDHRNRTGGFKSVEELREVDGVGDARFEQIKDLVTV